MSSQPIVVCPLEFERRALLGAGLGTLCRIECCGPGPAAVAAWAGDLAPPATVILCGLAGSARDPYHERAAFAALAVVLDDGRRLDPPLGAGPCPAPLIGSADRTLATPLEKIEWARRTGADLVDLESATFARLAAERGWRWTVVRGVSDGPRTALPAGLGGWVDDRGRTRLGAVCRAIVRRRAGIRQLIRLRSASRAAMLAAAEVIRPMLEDPGRAFTLMPTQRVLIFGGTFDPPHVAHATLPTLVARRFRCDRIVYVPAAVNPLKMEFVAAPAEHRLTMLRLAVARVPDVEISTIELDRPGPSYMVDTLEAIGAELGSDVELRLLIGSDAALQFAKWKRWKRILELATPAVMVRPPLDETTYRRRIEETFGPDEARQWLEWTAAVPYLDICATGLRRLLAEGGDLRGLLQPPVLDYIREHGLYGQAAS